MKPKQRILVFRFSAMGDVAMTVPVLQALVAQNPEVEVIMISRAFFAPFFKELPGVSFVGVDLKNKYKGFSGLFRLYKELKKYQPDAIADLHDVLRTKVLRIFFRLSGFSIQKIDKGRAEKKALTRGNNKILKALKTTHERYADVFRGLGYTIDLNNVQYIRKDLSSQVRLFLQSFESDKLVGIAPFAAHIGKQYPLQNIKEVINLLLKEEHLSILLFGGGAEEKKQLQALESINRNRVVNLAGMFSFEEELQIISRVNVMLSMDSGNAHIAALYGVPVISIWGATHPFAGFAPFKQKTSQQLHPDLQKYPQLPTSIYGNKTFEGFDHVWDSIRPEEVAVTVLNNL